MKNLFIIIILFPFILFSQSGSGKQQGSLQGEYTIEGFIKDSLSEAPLEYANVTVHRLKDSSLVNGITTNSKGYFKIENMPQGKFLLIAKYMGYKNRIVKPVLLSKKNEFVNVGSIKLISNAQGLSEVVVKADRDLMLNNLDKKVINVDQNIASAGGTAVDVMQNVPSVSVDADGGIALRGNTNVTILIDGKPNSMAGISGSDLLSQLPASSIESIEIITNPSAKYDPDGTAGIINIVLKKKTNLGMNGLVSINAGSRDKYNSSINFNTKNESFLSKLRIDAEND